MHYLVVTNDEDDVDLHGPFDTIREAQDYAERYRAMLELPIEATPENNEEWTERGWYFGIFAPRLLPQFQGRGGGQMGGQLTVSQTDKTTRRMTATFAVEAKAPWLKLDAPASDSESLAANAATYLDILTGPRGLWSTRSPEHDDDPAYVLSDPTVFAPSFAEGIHDTLVAAQEAMQEGDEDEALRLIRAATDDVSLIAFDRVGG